MKKLSAHIEKLLLNHDCVIIPEFGGFVAYYEPAKYNNGFFTPPARKIGFNINLTYNDGLLAQSIMQTEGCTYERAQRIISLEIQISKELLNIEHEIAVGKIGTLFLNTDEVLYFEPDEEVSFAPKYYGLAQIRYSQIRKTLISKDYVFPKFTRNVAAAIALFLILLPINFLNNNSSQQASVLPTTWTVTPQNNNEIIKDETIFPENIFADTLNTTDTILTETTAKIEDKITPEEYLEEFYPEKTYHIIIASLPNARLANQYLQEVKDFAFNEISVVEADKRFRISVKEFFDAKTAERFLELFKSDYSDFSEAWIYEKAVNL
jgi:hypothetical protein